MCMVADVADVADVAGVVGGAGPGETDAGHPVTVPQDADPGTTVTFLEGGVPL